MRGRLAYNKTFKFDFTDERAKKLVHFICDGCPVIVVAGRYRDEGTRFVNRAREWLEATFYPINFHVPFKSYSVRLIGIHDYPALFIYEGANSITLEDLQILHEHSEKTGSQTILVIDPHACTLDLTGLPTIVAEARDLTWAEKEAKKQQYWEHFADDFLVRNELRIRKDELAYWQDAIPQVVVDERQIIFDVIMEFVTATHSLFYSVASGVLEEVCKALEDRLRHEVVLIPAQKNGGTDILVYCTGLEDTPFAAYRVDCRPAAGEWPVNVEIVNGAFGFMSGGDPAAKASMIVTAWCLGELTKRSIEKNNTLYHVERGDFARLEGLMDAARPKENTGEEEA